MSLQGWDPEIGPSLTLEEVIELAFDYRGNTTIVTRDGAEIVGYIFNRDAGVPEPFLEFFDEAGEGPFTLRYADVATIRFTGEDTAAGQSWKAWVERRERSGPRAAGSTPEQPAHPDGG